MSITTSEKLIKVSAVTKNTSIQQKYYYTKIVKNFMLLYCKKSHDSIPSRFV